MRRNRKERREERRTPTIKKVRYYEVAPYYWRPWIGYLDEIQWNKILRK